MVRRSTARVIDKDRGYKRLRAHLKDMADGPGLYVGLQGKDNERTEGGPTNAEIATWHEFGTSTGVPERSFLRSTADAERAKYADMLSRGLGRVADGALSVDQVLGLIGERVVADVRKRVKDNIPPELKPETIRRKTRADGATASTPLVMTTQLLRAISWVIRRGKAGV